MTSSRIASTPEICGGTRRCVARAGLPSSNTTGLMLISVHQRLNQKCSLLADCNSHWFLRENSTVSANTWLANVVLLRLWRPDADGRDAPDGGSAAVDSRT